MERDLGGDRVVTQQLTGLRARLADPQHRALAAFVGIPRVEVVQIVGLAGYDIVILDGEHGAFDASGMAALVAAGHGVGLDVVVRVPELRAQIGTFANGAFMGAFRPRKKKGAVDERPNTIFWDFERVNRRLRFLRYGPGQFFRPHCDGAYSEQGADGSVLRAAA